MHPGALSYRCGSDKRRGKSRFVEKKREIRSRLNHNPGGGRFQRPAVTVGPSHQLSCATCSASPAAFAVSVFIPPHSGTVCQAPQVPCGVCPVPRTVAHPCHQQHRTRGEQSSRGVRGWVQTVWDGVGESPSPSWDRPYRRGNAAALSSQSPHRALTVIKVRS